MEIEGHSAAVIETSEGMFDLMCCNKVQSSYATALPDNGASDQAVSHEAKSIEATQDVTMEDIEGTLWFGLYWIIKSSYTYIVLFRPCSLT